MKLIGFTGIAQSGKTTASSFLEEKYGFIKIGFKNAIINEIKKNMPDFLEAEARNHTCTVDDLFEFKPGSFRQFMQNYGTDLRRGEDDSYWINKWLTEANEMVAASDYSIVVDDVRFLNEADIVRKCGGIIIRVVREGQEKKMNHVSETEMDKIIPDYEIVVKEGDVDALCNEIQKIYEGIK